jgi:hypothetical protein
VVGWGWGGGSVWWRGARREGVLGFLPRIGSQSTWWLLDCLMHGARI